jgi:hypothetical protein
LMAICHGALFLFCFVCFDLLHIPTLLYCSLLRDNISS